MLLLSGLVAGSLLLARDSGEGPSALTLDGNLLQADGERFVLAGASAYVLPFYTDGEGGPDVSLAQTSERSYQEREQMLDRMRDSGVNTLRIPVARSGYDEDVYGLGGQAGYLDRLQTVVAAAAERDIRVIVGWWDSHSVGAEWLDTYQDVFPMMRDVREALTPWPSVVYEPFNEPHDVTWEQWEPVMADVISFWRDELDYDGVLLIDTIGYSWSFDPEVADRVLEHDAALRDGEPAVVFANHRYANYETCFCGEEQEQWEREVGQYVDDYPIAGTEYGRWTGPEFTPQEQWNVQFAEHATEVAIPAGLNGYVAFVWDWVDENSMTEQDGQQLNAYGRLVTEEVFAEYGLSS